MPRRRWARSSWTPAAGRALLHWPAQLRILTYATLLLEIVGPLLFVITVRRARLRLAPIGCGPEACANVVLEHRECGP